MSGYTVERLRKDGPPFAMAMLLRALAQGESFVTYGAIKAELEFQLGIDRIFPTQIGHVAGSLMNQILDLQPRAPLINVLITRANGIPGTGAGHYLAERYNAPRLKNWEKLSSQERITIVSKERKKIFRYRKWEEINRSLFGKSAKVVIRKPPEEEADFSKNRFGGLAESDEHKKLKAWIAKHPESIGLSTDFGLGAPEYRLLSGDEVDVMFVRDDIYRAVEVKSIISSDDDLKRGIYQCVKYREVKCAEIHPFDADVKSMLVAERNLPPELMERAKSLGIGFKCVLVNKKSRHNRVA